MKGSYLMLRQVAWAIGLMTFSSLPVSAQVQIRLGDPARTTYSEVHEGLRDGTPAADTVRAILGSDRSRVLWPRVRRALEGKGDWNIGLVALTRIAELREPASVDSAKKWRGQIERGTLKVPPGQDAADLVPGLRAIELEASRATSSDAQVLAALLPRIPSGDYDLADAWVFGRLRQGVADTVAARFLATDDPALRIRYLTLMSFSTDSALIPLLARIYVAPDSFGLPRRIGMRASDGLIWIGTRHGVAALLDARASARTRGTYADPHLGQAGLDFLGNDSSLVISRTGRWLTDWVGVLK
jgi:hypothetical protein